MRRFGAALRVTGLLVLTVAAAVVMALVNVGTKRSAEQTLVPEGSAAVRVPVAVERVERETIEILDRYAGMIRPWERYTLAFEVGGRIAHLGTNDRGEPLDEGDRVAKGQVLAQLDDRALRARKSEASARLEQAASNLQRARRVRQENPGAITETDLQDRVTELTLAKAQAAIALKNLEDATLVAPAAGTLSRRLAQQGESVTPHQAVFEMIEDDRVLLVLGVPESNLPELQARMAEVRRARAAGDPRGSEDAAPPAFRAHVRLIERNRIAGDRRQIEGTVRRISPTADDRTGLFDVEVVLPNEDGMLRPGMIARADLVTAEVKGYRLPADSVVFRSRGSVTGGPSRREVYVYVVEDEPVAVKETAYPPAGPPRRGQRARRVDLLRWVEQGDEVIVIEAAAPLERVVRRGQHRLIDRQPVEIVPFDPPGGAPPGRLDPHVETKRS